MFVSNYRADPTRPDRAKAITGVVAVYVAIGGLMLLAGGDAMKRAVQQEPTVLVDVKELPEPQPPPEDDPGKTKEEEGAGGKKAEPTPVVAPKPAIEVPSTPPIVAAPIAGTGSASTAGAATSGTGPGAGGSGTGRGGGGSDGGGGIGSAAKLLGGNSSRLSASLLRGFAADRGYGHLWLTVSKKGRVTDCSVLQSTGDAQVDRKLCNLMVRRSRWAPARDQQGKPITVSVRYTATWRKN